MNFLLQILGDFHYLGLFIALLFCGAGLPLPEDIVIITGGYLAHLGQIKLIPTIVVLWTGALAGDIMLYSLGRRFGPDILAHRRLTWIFTAERIHTINHYFHRYGSLTLFFARFLVGLRSPIFLSAGAFKIPFKKMIFFDGSAALISIPLITYLAYRFGDQLDELIFWMRRVEHIAIVLVVLALVFIVLRVRYRLKKSKLGKAEEVLIPPTE